MHCCTVANVIQHMSCCCIITAVFLFIISAACNTHPALPAVGQELVFFFRVEDERVRGEGDGLSLEGGSLVSANKQHLISFIDG